MRRPEVSLRLNDFVRDAIRTVEPGDDFSCAFVIHSFVSLSKRFLFLSQAIETNVLKCEEIFSNVHAEFVAKDRDTRLPKRFAVLIGVAPAVAIG